MTTDRRPDYYDFTFDMFLTSAEGEKPESVRFSEWIAAASRDGVYSFEARHLHGQATEVDVRRPDGTLLHVLNFASYNYLGYSQHPEVIAAAKEALDRFGLGACSSPVQAGTMAPHIALERALLDFFSLPERGVSIFSSGYAVNTGTISALMKRGDHIVVDSSAHMSIMEGAQLARSKIHLFQHNDAEHLNSILKDLEGQSGRILVCAEGVYSADGDYGTLDKLIQVAKSYGAQVLVDEAHSFLLCGSRGRGVAEELGVLEHVDYFVLTFSKALAGVGGALIARHDVAQYVNWFARCRMFSCALDPAVTAGITRSLELGGGSDGQQRRRKLHANAATLRNALVEEVNIGNTRSWVVPVIFGADTLTIPLADWLQRNGLDGSVMSFPAVPVDEARVRLFVTSEHTDAQIHRGAEIIKGAAKKFDFARSAHAKS
jgi:7-keto-8-aminopelargonate synthetase-like enzyme